MQLVGVVAEYPADFGWEQAERDGYLPSQIVAVEVSIVGDQRFVVHARDHPAELDEPTGLVQGDGFGPQGGLPYRAALVRA